MRLRSLAVVVVLVVVLAGVVAAFLVTTGVDSPTSPEGDPPTTEPAPATERPPSAPETFPVTGRVVDSRGRALAGATVETAGQRTTTDTRGSFELAAVGVGRHTVAAWAEGHVLKTVEIRVPDAPLEIRLSRFRTGQGIVRFADGAPAADVPVIVGIRRGDDTHEITVTTDAEGRYTVERLPPGRLSVRVESFTRDGVPYVRKYGKRAGTNAEVTLAEGAVFAGRVRAPDGRPVPAPYVYVRTYPSRGSGIVHATTGDEEGRFSLIVAKDTAYSLIIETRTDDETGWRYPRWFRHNVRPGGPSIDATLEPGFAIAGRVDGPRGQVAGRKLEAHRVAGNQTSLITVATIQPDGTFRFGGLWKARYELRLRRQGDDDPYLLMRPRVVATGAADAKLVMVRGRTLSGTLVDQDGVELADTWLQLVSTEKQGTRRTETDDEGRFRFERLPPGTWQVRLIGRPEGPLDLGTVESGTTALRLEVDPAED